jgi:hypothetical protein
MIELSASSEENRSQRASLKTSALISPRILFVILADVPVPLRPQSLG